MQSDIRALCPGPLELALRLAACAATRCSRTQRATLETESVRAAVAREFASHRHRSYAVNGNNVGRLLSVEIPDGSSRSSCAYTFEFEHADSVETLAERSEDSIEEL